MAGMAARGAPGLDERWVSGGSGGRNNRVDLLPSLLCWYGGCSPPTCVTTGVGQAFLPTNCMAFLFLTCAAKATGDQRDKRRFLLPA